VFDDGEEVHFSPKQNRITAQEVKDFFKRTPMKRNFWMPSIIVMLMFDDDKNHLVRDPFILILRPALEMAFKSHDEFVRLHSLELLTRMPLDQDTLTSYLQTALKDESSLLRRTAADSAGALDFKSLVKDIRSAMKSSDSGIRQKNLLQSSRAVGKTLSIAAEFFLGRSNNG
jgi:hypothetical protein